MIMNRNSNKEQAHKTHRQTPQRRLVLDLISEAKGHIDAKELFRLAVQRDASISPATVYRSLNFFKEQGLIEEKHLGHSHCYYEIKGSVQHQHLVCGKCGKVIEFDCNLMETIEKVKNEHRFVITRAEVYLEGYCEECAQEGE